MTDPERAVLTALLNVLNHHDVVFTEELEIDLQEFVKMYMRGDLP